MLDAQLQQQLQGYLTRLTQPIEIVASLDDSQASDEMAGLLRTIAEMSTLVRLRTDGQDARKPSFSLARSGEAPRLRFAGLPLGHEFTSLVLALLWTGGHPPKVDPDTLSRLQALSGPKHFEVYMSLSCHNCPDVVQALCLMAAMNPAIDTVVIEGGLFQSEVEARQIMAVPSVYLDGTMFGAGRMSIEDILRQLDQGAAARTAAALAEQAPFDVLIVGGGPAGAAAAVYAARKGIRTGLAVDRMGGQTNDTLAIENYISVLATDGPRFAAALEAQVRHYGVEVMTSIQAVALLPASGPDGLVGVRFDNGATLNGRSVIVSTGARWRTLNVPGEEAYKNKGVAYCPHCDGPLFKGKRVAVIGGGNSGVEAAIDLAGLVKHVTLIEFSDQLKADALLVQKLRSLPNVTVRTQAKTQEILGDGHKVTGLTYQDRSDGSTQRIELDGVFVQIGLVPNTEWLQDSVRRNRFGEIEVDAKGATNVPGVFAAGDCTDTPYKQIVIAAGDGAKAALSAFDHLIRSAPASDLALAA